MKTPSSSAWALCRRMLLAGGVLLLGFTANSWGAAAQAITYDSNGNLLVAASSGIAMVPAIVSQPSNQLGQPGGTVFFSVAAAGTGPLTYQWQFNGMAISAGANPSAAKATLILNPVASANVGTYRVVVSNSAGSVTSQSAALQLDSVGDGIPDDWKMAHFGAGWASNAASAALADPDGDGVTNREEYLDGTDPNSAVSRFYRLTVTGGTVRSAPRADRFAPGTLVTLTASPQANREFAAWTGDVTSGVNPLRLTMNRDYRVGAVYGVLPLDRPTIVPSFTSTGAVVYGLARQADGKVLAAGSFQAIGGQARFGVARFNVDGSLEANFTPSVSGTIEAIAVQTDGRIIIAGSMSAVNGVARYGIARLNADGSLDTTFDTGTQFGFEVRALSYRPSDGKITFGGTYLARVNPDGSKDTTFSTGSGLNNNLYAMTTQPDGRVVIGGVFTTYNGVAVPRIMRLNDDGSVDSTFTATATGIISSIVARSDGSLFVASPFGTLDGANIRGLALLNANGSLNSSFQLAAGVSVQQVSGQPGLYLQGDGKLLVTGSILMGNGAASTGVARFDSNGNLDSTLAVTHANSLPASAITDANGDIYLGGFFSTVNDAEHLALAHVSGADGALDPDFTLGASKQSGASVVAAQPDGGMIVGGNFNVVNGVICEKLAHLFPDGSLDAGFNSGLGNGPDGAVIALLLQPDNSVVIGGGFQHYRGEPASYLARLNADGTRDTSFISNTPGPYNLSALALDAYGDVLAAGVFTSINGQPRQGVARFFPDGTLDPDFAPSYGSGQNYVFTLAIQPDGKILVAGQLNQQNGDYLVRFNDDGTLDPSFTSPNFNQGYAQAVAVTPGGNIIVAGNFTLLNSTAVNGVARLHSDGSFDGSFQQTTLFPGSIGASIALEPDGHIFVGGAMFTLSYNSPLNLLRLGANGVRDPDFLLTGAPDLPVSAVCRQGNGSVVIVGNFGFVGGDPRLGYARFVPSTALRPGVISLSPGQPAYGPSTPFTLSLTPESDNGAVTAVNFEQSADGVTFAPLGIGSSDGAGNWTFNLGGLPTGIGYFRAVITNLNAATAISDAVGPLGALPVIQSVARISTVVGDPFHYEITATGYASNLTADNLPDWAIASFDPATGVLSITGTPPFQQVDSIILTATNFFGSVSVPLEIVVSNRFLFWEYTYFSPDEINNHPEISGPLGDATGAGITNLVKYALGIAPKTPGVAGLPTVSLTRLGGSDFLTLTYTRDLTAYDVALSVEASGNLSGWNSGANFLTEISRTDNGNGTETVVTRDNFPTSGAARRFIRLHAEIP